MLREASILKDLSKVKGSENHISRLREIFWVEESSTGPYSILVMDFLEGETLQAFIHKCLHKEVKLTPKMVEKILFNLLRAVSFVHSSNVIHRDIKPQNIIIN